MRQIAKWTMLMFVVLVALSPLFETFDKTDDWAQDTSDLARYVICLFGFLIITLRHGVVTIAGSASLRDWIPGPIALPLVERNLIRASARYGGLFLTFHDLRI